MDKMMERKGLSRLGTIPGKTDPLKNSAIMVHGENEDGTKVHTIEEHPDGHFETHMHDGTHETHPDHLHMLAHIGHHITGGDKHHVVHHDGMMGHSHGIHESGEHDGTHDHENLEEMKESLGKFIDEEGNEGEYGKDGEEEEGEDRGHAFGGMMG
jgi:hypothetical protein